MLRKLNKIAQSTAEYAIIIAIVVGAVIAMQVYVKRGIQGRVKDVVDYVGKDTDTDAKAIFTSGQYEPDYSQSNMEMKSNAQRQESMQAGGGVTRNILGETSTSTGVRKVGGATGASGASASGNAD